MSSCWAARIAVSGCKRLASVLRHRSRRWPRSPRLILFLVALVFPHGAWADPAPTNARGDTPLRNWYFAEGNSRHEFQTFFSVFNVTDKPASVTASYQRDDGIRLTQWLGVEPGARISFNANEIVGPRAFGATFSADADVVIERSTTWGPGQDAETVVGFAPRDMQNWYFAEGTTRGHVTTYFVSQNLSDSPATVNATFTRDDGKKTTRSYTLAPRQREAYRMDDLMPDTAFSARFSSDQDIVMERTIMRESDTGLPTPPTRSGDARKGLNGDAGGGVNPGTNTIGVFGGLGYVPIGDEVGAHVWSFAEGSTRRPYETFFVLFNPGSAVADVRLQYAVSGGGTPSQSVQLPPRGRKAFSPKNLVPAGDFATTITASQPIVVERSYLSTGDGMYGAMGFTPTPTRSNSRAWYFAEGNTTGQNELYFLVSNLSDQSATVHATFFADDGQQRERVFNVGSGGRLSVRANDLVPNQAFASRFLADQDVVVERTMYFSGQSGFATFGAGVGL